MLAGMRQAVSCRMTDLNFPGYAFFVRGTGSSRQIFDAISQKYVALTPEEWVRQHLVQYLVQEKCTPIGLMRREVSFRSGVSMRADIVVYDRSGRPVVVVECKAPGVALNQSTLDQVGRYNNHLRAPYIAITNGLSHYFCYVNRARGTIQSIDDLPMYDEFSRHA